MTSAPMTPGSGCLRGYARRSALPGCLAFIPYETDGIPGKFFLYEVFADAEAFEVHLETDHVKEFRATLPSVSESGPNDLAQLIEIAVA
jgi:quinol monooxygenase YgiN